MPNQSKLLSQHAQPTHYLSQSWLLGRVWSDDADAKLQDCFASTDFNMFRGSSDGIEEYTISVTGIINKCIDDVVPTVTIRTHPNQKPWMTVNIHTELKSRAASSMKCCYALRRAIKQAKR